MSIITATCETGYSSYNTEYHSDNNYSDASCQNNSSSASSTTSKASTGKNDIHIIRNDYTSIQKEKIEELLVKYKHYFDEMATLEKGEHNATGFESIETLINSFKEIVFIFKPDYDKAINLLDIDVIINKNLKRFANYHRPELYLKHCNKIIYLKNKYKNKLIGKSSCLPCNSVNESNTEILAKFAAINTLTLKMYKIIKLPIKCESKGYMPYNYNFHPKSPHYSERDISILRDRMLGIHNEEKTYLESLPSVKKNVKKINLLYKNPKITKGIIRDLLKIATTDPNDEKDSYEDSKSWKRLCDTFIPYEHRWLPYKLGCPKKWIVDDRKFWNPDDISEVLENEERKERKRLEKIRKRRKDPAYQISKLRDEVRGLESALSSRTKNIFF